MASVLLTLGSYWICFSFMCYMVACFLRRMNRLVLFELSDIVKKLVARLIRSHLPFFALRTKNTPFIQTLKILAQEG